MSIKSEYVIHWTGKKINTEIKSLTISQRVEYINRLKKTCETGLWMMPNEEKLKGRGEMGFRSFSFITCFTENRINHYQQHAQKYGLMGFGFTKEWVLERDGMPVIYLKNGSTDTQTQLMSELVFALKEYKDAQGKIDESYYRKFGLLLDYAKPMSTESTNDFAFLEEAEWRICWNNLNKNIKENVGTKPPEYYLPFTANELKLIILPDITCRKIVLSDPDFLNFYQSGNCEALILSLEEIEKL